jgi:hypothetical protein
LQGQYIGPVGGDVPALGVLELDDDGEFLDGIAYHFPDDPKAPSVCAYVRFPKRDGEHHMLDLSLIAVHPEMGNWMSPDEVAEKYPDYVVARLGDIILNIQGEEISFAYSTEFTKGDGTLRLTHSARPSTLDAQVMSWDEFRNSLVRCDPRQHVFRGQCSQHRLRTSFHRTKRKNLARYRDIDIDEIRRTLSPILRHVFDKRDPFQTGALFSLIQHHGFPTPLLDWSYSPFVAAYFAFRSRPGSRPPTDYVRIFEFDRRSYAEHFAASTAIAYARPHVTIVDFLGIENPRMIPQQATAMITNIDDIEGWIEAGSDAVKQPFLRAIDIPLAEREQALRELDLMGINAGSLFPGIDGACEALAYKNFGV